MEPTLPDKYRTYNLHNLSKMGDFTKYHPWRAPGRAPVSDSCGSAGAYIHEAGGGGETPIGSPQCFPGSKLPKLANVTTEWLAGGDVEVGWMVGANHGGGYVYSVCPAGAAITEDCFNAHVLPFVGDNTTIRYLDGIIDFDLIMSLISDHPTRSFRRHAAPHVPCDMFMCWCLCLSHAAWCVQSDARFTSFLLVFRSR